MFSSSFTAEQKLEPLVGPTDGAIPGEIRMFAVGGDKTDKVHKRLRQLGWLECAGQDLNDAEYPELFRVIEKTWGHAADPHSFFAPDLRGAFVRSWNHGKTCGADGVCDPGAAWRQAYQGNNTAGDKVATMQEDRVGVHEHELRTKPHGVAAVLGYGVPSGNGRTYMDSSVAEYLWAMGNTNDQKETRPRNITLMFMIYTGRAVHDHTP